MSTFSSQEEADRFAAMFSDSIKGMEPETVTEEKKEMIIDWSTPPSKYKKTKKYSEVFGEPVHLKNWVDFDVPYYEKSDWPEAAQEFIPGEMEGYVPDHKYLYPLLAAITRRLKVQIVGDTGSGKTEIKKYTCHKLNIPLFRLNFRGDMESDTILGKPWVEPVNGEVQTTFKLGSLPEALKEGFFIDLDEIFNAPAPILAALQRYMESDGILQIDDMPGTLAERQVRPHERSIVVLSSNTTGQGENLDKFAANQIQDRSFLNRIDVVIHMDYMSPTKEQEILKKRYPMFDDDFLMYVVQLINLIRQGNSKGQITPAASLRTAFSWLDVYQILKDVELSFEMAFLNKLPDDSERTAVQVMFENVFG